MLVLLCTSSFWCERTMSMWGVWNNAGRGWTCFHLCSSSRQPSINTTNIDTLLVATDQTERIVEPPDNVQEKIAFIFNNLSQSNMTQKVAEPDTACMVFRPQKPWTMAWLAHTGSW